MLDIEQTFDLASRQHQAGKLAEAEQLYRQILAERPDEVETIHQLGLLEFQTGRISAAISSLGRAIELDPAWPDLYCNLGNILTCAGHLEEAIAAYLHGIALDPAMPELHSNLASAHRHSGNLGEAIACYRRALALRPASAADRVSLGNVLRDSGQIDAAIAEFRAAIALSPQFIKAHSDLGIALCGKGQPGAAIASFRHAAELAPNLPEVQNNLGVALKSNGEFDEAIATYRRAIDIKPDYADAFNNLGDALREMRELDESVAAYRRAIALAPGNAMIHSNLIYSLYFLPDTPIGAIVEELGSWNERHARPLLRFAQGHSNDTNPERRLRIGYVSADFYGHACSHFLVPLFESHDRQQVEIFAYAEVSKPDETTIRLRNIAHHWRGTLGISDPQVAHQIREDKIDILVDLKLHTGANRLLVFAQSPAPVQATWLGYPGSTGMGQIDYRLSDPYLDPPGTDESIYSEQTIRLPHSFWCYDPLDGRDIPVNPLPAIASGRITFGCLNNLCKINDRVLALWAKVLHAVPGSRLLLLANEGTQRRQTVRQLVHEGIDAQRIEFVPRQPRRQYMRAYHRIDIGLDTFPYNGHTTSLDSYWMGVPVINLVGETAVARAGWCQLSNLRLTELAAQDAEQFVRLAVELAGDLPRLQLLRSTLRERMEQSPLMDAVGFARDMEAIYRKMWRNWCERKPV